jgi:SAM-dependent MidA family methyltransferase
MRCMARIKAGTVMMIESPSAEFLHAFAARADDLGTMRFDAFVDLALYDPIVGYYCRPTQRVGYKEGTDFFTASTSGPVFGELVAAACVKLLGERRVEEHMFIEIGAETRSGIMEGVAHPFRAARVIKVGETLELSGQCIVFSNELFDAQPFRRFRFLQGRWNELGVTLRDNALVESVLPDAASPTGPLELPSVAAEGYTIDAPIAAAKLAEIIVRPSWTGLFVAFDYGKSWRELIEACPAGTARAYFRHTQSNELLAHPGQQDLTCHICWDWLVAALGHHGFARPQIDSQESFFVRNAESYLAAAIAEDASRLTARKRSLMQLLHGSHLGQKFQVLHGLR